MNASEQENTLVVDYVPETARAAEKAMRRSALLAEASRQLSRSLDFNTTLATLSAAVTPSLADACQLILHDPSGGYWFAPNESSTPEGKNNATSSHARIATVNG